MVTFTDNTLSYFHEIHLTVFFAEWYSFFYLNPSQSKIQQCFPNNISTRLFSLLSSKPTYIYIKYYNLKDRFHAPKSKKRYPTAAVLPDCQRQRSEGKVVSWTYMWKHSYNSSFVTSTDWYDREIH